jgi:hypothetical protein
LRAGLLRKAPPGAGANIARLVRDEHSRPGP